MIKLRQMILSLKQLHKSEGIIYSMMVSGNGRGLFFKTSHIAQGSGMPKIPYPSYEKARKAADKMELKTGKQFKAYKCMFCEKYHVGKPLKPDKLI